jgi:hypothetical protein
MGDKSTKPTPAQRRALARLDALGPGEVWVPVAEEKRVAKGLLAAGWAKEKWIPGFRGVVITDAGRAVR